MAGVESKAVVGDFLDGPEHISRYRVAEPIRDEELAMPLPECQEYRRQNRCRPKDACSHWAKRSPTALAPESG
jgi:hypothetical protein